MKTFKAIDNWFEDYQVLYCFAGLFVGGVLGLLFPPKVEWWAWPALCLALSAVYTSYAKLRKRAQETPQNPRDEMLSRAPWKDE